MAEFSRIVQAMDGGRLEQALSALLYNLVVAVAAVQEPGSLNLRISVSPGADKPGRDARITDIEISVQPRIPGDPARRTASAAAPVILYTGELAPLEDMQLKIPFDPGQ